MNIDLEKTFSFPSILVNSNQVPWINCYEVRVDMRVITDRNSEYNIAYERMKFWFQDTMHSAVLIHAEDPKLHTWRDTGLACLDFPEQPLDQVLTLMLMSKLTAMAEGRVEILRVGTCSAADDWVMYFCDQTDHLHWFEEPGWWRDPGPAYATRPRHDRGHDKVISMNRGTDWKSHNLDWPLADTNIGNVSVLPVRAPDAPE